MNIEKLEEQFTKYEIARILGARSLQIAMDAPMLLKISEEELESFNFNPIEIAKRELMAGVLPITVNRPLPKKKEAKGIKKLTREELEEMKRKEKEAEKLKEKEAAEKVEGKVKSDDKKLETEEIVEEKEVAEDGEIMELATPEDEVEETSDSAEEGI